MARLRISAISFLNTAPLMWDFDHGDLRRDFEIFYTLPSACAESLRTGTADIGIVPVVAYSFIPGLKVIPDVAIASKRSVRSILLVCKKPIDEVATVAADTSSRTSVALARVLFRKVWGGARQLQPMAPDLPQMLRQCDAALIIGDPALTADRDKFVCYDLAEEWNRLTGKPFVFAFWAVRAEAAERSPLDLAKIFQTSRDNGLQNIEALAREWAPRVGLTEPQVRAYLIENIDFSLDADNLAGMELFFQYAVECGAIAAAPPLEFVGEKTRSTP
jgi:chorismate dehydratase